MEMDSGFEHDATATWSGFIYQGYVAIYLAVKKICELLSAPYGVDKETIGLRYQLEIENWEDVSIVRDDENGRCYLSIHQVKNRNEKNINAYKKALVQLMLEKSFLRKQNLGMPKAYLHTSSEIKEDEAKINQLLCDWKNSVLNYYHEIVTLVGDGIKEDDGIHFQKKIIEIIEKEPIELNRVAYKNLLNDIKVCVKNGCNLEKLMNCANGLVEYLNKELAVEGIDENIRLYQYDDNTKFSNGEELFKKIVEQVKHYKIITNSSDNLINEQYEYITDKLLGYMRKQILSRHELMKNKQKYNEQIPFTNVIQIMDESISDYEAKANIEALRRIYDDALSEYCLVSCKNACEGIVGFKCRLLNSKGSKMDLNDGAFQKMCFSYNPNCSKKIEDRACLNELMQKDGLEESVFEVLRKVPEQYFVEEKDGTRTVLKDLMESAFLTAIVGSTGERVVKNIVEGINKNTELVSPIFEADELITANLHTDDGTLWDSDYSEIDEKYMSRESMKNSDDNRNSICKPKKPKFIKAQKIIEKLV